MIASVAAQSAPVVEGRVARRKDEWNAIRWDGRHQEAVKKLSKISEKNLGPIPEGLQGVLDSQLSVKISVIERMSLFFFRFVLPSVSMRTKMIRERRFSKTLPKVDMKIVLYCWCVDGKDQRQWFTKNGLRIYTQKKLKLLEQAYMWAVSLSSGKGRER